MQQKNLSCLGFPRRCAELMQCRLSVKSPDWDEAITDSSPIDLMRFEVCVCLQLVTVIVGKRIGSVNRSLGTRDRQPGSMADGHVTHGTESESRREALSLDRRDRECC